MERGHRRVFYATEGSATLPGRFAIDYMKVDKYGKLSAGDTDIPANHYGFGAEVLAVADGTIIAVRDDVPDPASISGRPTICARLLPNISARTAAAWHGDRVAIFWIASIELKLRGASGVRASDG